MVQSKENCIGCNLPFERPKQRGRPPTRCPQCRETFLAEKEAKQIEIIAAIDPEVLYSGPLEALKGNRKTYPRGAQSQCPICFRIFFSDASCENHKSYPLDGSKISCKDPATIGFVAYERNGLPVWRKPSDTTWYSKEA